MIKLTLWPNELGKWKLTPNEVGFSKVKVHKVQWLTHTTCRLARNSGHTHKSYKSVSRQTKHSVSCFSKTDRNFAAQSPSPAPRTSRWDPLLPLSMHGPPHGPGPRFESVGYISLLPKLPPRTLWRHVSNPTLLDVILRSVQKVGITICQFSAFFGVGYSDN